MANLNSEFNIELKGHHHWELFFEIDNPSSESIHREVEVMTEVAISYEELVRSVESSLEGLNMGGIIDVMSVKVKGELHERVKMEYKRMAKLKRGYHQTTTIKNDFDIDAKSSVQLYRLVLTGPGLSYTSDSVSTFIYPVPDILIEGKVRLLPVLRDIQVVTTSDLKDRPDKLIQEVRGGSADVRRGDGGDGGKYTWLRPIWTWDVSEGLTGIRAVVTPEVNPGYVNLDMGEEAGPFRYLERLRDPQSRCRITEIVLWRSGSADESPMADGKFQFATGNFNEGIGGDYIYLCWNVRDHYQ